MNPLLRLILLLALGTGLFLVWTGVIWADNAANRGITFTPVPTTPSANGPIIAVNFFNLHLEPDPAAVRRSLELAVAMGARYGRMQVPWDDIEIHARGDFEDRRNLEAVGVVSAWAKYDRLVTEANVAGIELIWRLERPPAWARTQANATPEFQAGLLRDGNSTGPPDDLADYINFVRAVVERYDGDGVDDAPGSPTVRHFQIWNEPNLKNEWGWQEPLPEAFVALLRAGATAAREANPDALILFPGLAPTDGLDSSAPMTELEYLDRVYKAGGADYFDIMAAQAYGLGQPPDERRYVFLRGRGNWHWRRPIDTRNDVSRVVLLREVMEANGDHATPVWVTEFGWNSAPDSIPPERRLTWGDPVSETVKGAYLVGQMQRARDEWPWMGVMSIWMLRYGGYAEPNPDDPTPYFALVSRDWQILPAYTAIQSFAAEPAVMGVGTHHWEHPAIESKPNGWRVRFSGTRLTLLGGLDPEANPIEGTLNGVPNSLIREIAHSQRAWITPALPDGIHTLEVTGGPPPELLLVERVRPWGWLWDYGPFAILVGLAGVGAVTMPLLFQQLDHMRQRFTAGQRSPRGRNGLTARFMQPDTLIMAGLLLGAIIAYRGSAQVPITLAGLSLFGVLALLRPDLALLTIPLALPFYFIPKGLFDARFGIRDSGIYLPIHEILLLITLAAGSLAWVWHTLRRSPSSFLLPDSDATPVVVGTPPISGANPHGSPISGATTRVPPGSGANPHVSPISGAWGAMGSPKTLFRDWGNGVPPIPTILFIVAALWGVIIAESRGPALRELRWLVLEPLLFIGAATVAAAWWTRTQRGDYWLAVVRVWLIGGTLAGTVGLLQWLGLNLAPLFGTKAGFSDDSFLVEGVRRVTSLYGHPNNLGLAMGRFWPVAAALAYAAWMGAASPQAGLRRAWPYLLATSLTLAGLVVSFSRGAYLGAGVAALILAVALLPRTLWHDRRLWWLGGGLLTGASLAVVIGLTLGIERLNPFGATSSIRVQTWTSALTMLRDHPLGLGLDQFGLVYPRYIDPELVGTNEVNTAHPHNLVLDTALRMGPLGLIAFAWLIIGMVRKLGPSVRSGVASRHGDLRLGLGQRHPHSNSSRRLSAQSPPARDDEAAQAGFVDQRRGVDANNTGVQLDGGGAPDLRWTALHAGLAAALAASLVHGMVDQFYFWPDLAFAFWLFVALAQQSAHDKVA